jgi:hypothetical protein
LSLLRFVNLFNKQQHGGLNIVDHVFQPNLFASAL